MARAAGAASTSPSSQRSSSRAPGDPFCQLLKSGTGTSAANFIYEAAHAEGDWGATSPAPIGMAVFAADDMRRYVLNHDVHIECWTEFDRGGISRPWRYPTS